MAQGTTLSTGRILWTRWLPVLAYVAMIFTLSAQPHLVGPLRFENGDKIEHMAEYGGLGFLLVRALRASMPHRTALAVSILTVLLTMGIAAGDERFQSIIPGRECSIFDWYADSLGATFAQIVFFLTVRAEEL